MNNGAAKFAKLRPMRVEMHCIYWNEWFGENQQQSTVETLHATS